MCLNMQHATAFDVSVPHARPPPGRNAAELTGMLNTDIPVGVHRCTRHDFIITLILYSLCRGFTGHFIK